MTISFQIAQALQAHLQTISTANGYRTEAGQDVAIFWRHLDRSSPIPCLTLTGDGRRKVSDVNRGRNQRIQIQWTVEGLAEIGPSTLEVLYDIDEDVERAIFTPNPDLDGLVRRLDYVRTDLFDAEEGSRIARIQVIFETEHAKQIP